MGNIHVNALRPRSKKLKKLTIVFVLGGPGAGKGTQCMKLVNEFGFIHLSTGDLLRVEKERLESKDGKLIKEYILEGKIVPMDIVIKLIKIQIQTLSQKGFQLFLIDGFPRQMDQALKFESDVCESDLVLFLTCSESKLLPRLIERGKTSGREDDNEESIKKRFRTFLETSLPVVEYYQQKGKVLEVDSSGTVDQIYSDISVGIKSRIPTLEAISPQA